MSQLTMKTAKRKRLKGAGWRVGAVREFIGLNETEHELLEMRVALTLGAKRAEIGLSSFAEKYQQAFAAYQHRRSGITRNTNDFDIALEI